MVSPQLDLAKYTHLSVLLDRIVIADTDYERRYGLVLEAVAEARRLGLATGFRIDPAEPEWPVAYIELLFGGQVSWHLPQHPFPWDGHRTEEKFRRIGIFRRVVDGRMRQ